MDDRNLVAVAEQAAATSRVLRGSLEGATVKFDDGRVFLGCRLEFADPALDQDAISNALAAGRVEGAYRPVRIGLYSPVAEGLPRPAAAALRRLAELAEPGLEVLVSAGTGERRAFALEDLLREADPPAQG